MWRVTKIFRSLCTFLRHARAWGAKKKVTVTFFTCTSAPGGVAAPKVLPRPAWLRQKSCRPKIHPVLPLRVSFIYLTKYRNIIGAARVFFKWTPGEFSCFTHKTRHLNPSPWQCYSLYWQRRHELISSEEGEGGEGRGKAAA